MQKLVQRVMRIIIYIAAADVFSLFICLAFASSAGVLMRIVCTVFTTGILASLLISLGLKMAKEDSRSGEMSLTGALVIYGRAVSFFPELSWVMLLISYFKGGNFYRIHKLINGWFLSLFNIIEPGISSAELSGWHIFIFMILAEVPFWLFVAGYLLGMKRDE